MATQDDSGYDRVVMQPLKAHVKEGKLVLDDPTTDLPEGNEVELYVVGDDEFEPEEQARLDDSIQESIEQMKAGNLIDAKDALAELRNHR